MYASVWKPLEDISCVSWNRQVQHILASASPSGRASVWDLRKNDLILKVSDHSNRVRSLFFVTLQLKRQTFTVLLFCLFNLHKIKINLMVVCLLLDALLRFGLEPGSGHSVGVGFGGRSDAGHPDVGLTLCYLSSQDFRESHTVNAHLMLAFYQSDVRLVISSKYGCVTPSDSHFQL